MEAAVSQCMALSIEFPTGTEKNKEHLIRTSGLWVAIEIRDVPHTKGGCQFVFSHWYITDAHC